MSTLYWIDLETTGLNPYRDHILEIAISTARMDAPWDLTPVYHEVFRFEEVLHPMMDAYVTKMHTNNGLLAECARADRYAIEAEAAILKVIPVEAEKGYLAGSTVHFDRSFLAMRLPRIETRFHHRHFDVSAIKLLCKSMGMADLPKGEGHRAREDVIESAQHGKRCQEWLRGTSLPTLTTLDTLG